MTIDEAKRITGGGITPAARNGLPEWSAKMSGTTYRLPAKDCIVEARPGKQFRNVAKSDERHLASLAHPRWVEAMALLLRASGTEWHRWHDSGDLQSVEHLGKLVDVACLTSWIWYWLPTRETFILRRYNQSYGLYPSNLLIRVSATERAVV